MRHKLKSSFLFLAAGFLCLNRTYGLSNLKAEAGVCGENSVHGLVAMKFGYDIRDYTSDTLKGFKKQEIFVFTCNDNASVPMPNYKEPLTFPDQFATPDPIMRMSYNKTAFFLETFEEFNKEAATGLETGEKKDTIGAIGEGVGSIAGKWGDIIGGIFKAIGAVVEFLTPHKKTVDGYMKHTKNAEYRAGVYVEMILYDLAYKNPRRLTLQEDFVKDLRNLPASFENNPLRYAAFLETYGTHYMYTATVGGRVKYSTKHTITGKRKDEQKVIEEEYKVWLESRLSNNSKSSKTQTRIHDQIIEVDVNGGDLSKALPSESINMSPWVESVYGGPSPIKVSFVPIIDLITNKTIQTQLALAIMYRINKQSVGRYKEMMEIIDKKSLPDELPFIEGLEPYSKIFKLPYAKIFDEVNGELQSIPKSIDGLLRNCTKEFHDKIKKLFILHKNIKAATELRIQMHLYYYLFDGVKAIHKIASNCNFYKGDITFIKADLSSKNYNAAKDLYKSLKGNDGEITEDQRISRANILPEIEEKLYALKAENDKFLNTPAFDCETLPCGTQISRCYQFTHCGLYRYMAGWSDKEPLSDLEKKAPWISNLRKMLGSMKHEGEWEKWRAIFAMNRVFGEDTNCNNMWLTLCWTN